MLGEMENDRIYNKREKKRERQNVRVEERETQVWKRVQESCREKHEERKRKRISRISLY